MNLKENIFLLYKTMLQEKINHIQQTLQDLGSSAANETKSTAGDKHETALAMLQLEQENKRKQLTELLQQQATLLRIDPAIVSPYVLNGSLVTTDQGYFFISVGLGKIEYKEKIIFALSPLAPLGQQLLNRHAGDSIELNGRHYIIIAVE
jgi:hypothetical protein